MSTNRITNEEGASNVEWLQEEPPPRHLFHTALLYKMLQGGHGIPTVRRFSQEDDHWVVLDFDLLGPSLENLFNYYNRMFSLKMVLMLANQMLDHIEYVHSKGFLHNEIKFENFVMGLGTWSHEAYKITFGLAVE